MTLRLARVEHLLGIPFDGRSITDLLSPLGFVCTDAGDGTLEVEVPGWRGADVTREVDLIEEVARRHGFERFPDELKPFRPGTVPDHPLFALEDRLRDLLCGMGFFEAQTPAFVPEEEGDVRLQNPLSKEEPVLRREVVPSLLRRLEYNLARGNRDVRLFELATSFRAIPDEEAPAYEEPRVALVVTGRRDPTHWSGGAEPVDIWDLKGLLHRVVALTWGGAAQVDPGEVVGFPGVAGATLRVVGADGRLLGGGGLVSGQSLDLPPWAGQVFALELTLPSEPSRGGSVAVRPLPAYPGVERDLALVVADAIPVDAVERTAREAAGALLESVDIFDLYQGEGLPEGTRSVAFRFRFRSPERTLTDDEVDRATRRITDRLGEELGVQVRGA